MFSFQAFCELQIYGSLQKSNNNSLHCFLWSKEDQLGVPVLFFGDPIEKEKLIDYPIDNKKKLFFDSNTISASNINTHNRLVKILIPSVSQWGCQLYCDSDQGGKGEQCPLFIMHSYSLYYIHTLTHKNTFQSFPYP